EGERSADDCRQPSADDGVRAHVSALDVIEVHRAAVAVRAPLELSVQLGHELVRRRPLGEGVTVRAVRRGNDVDLFERTADADCHGLLTDRHMEEPGQLAGAEPFLDLLLEPPDEQHLAKEIAQIRLRERPLLLHLRHEAQFMLTLLRLVEQFNELERGLEEDWTELSLQLTLENVRRSERVAALLAPTNPGRFGPRIRFTVNRGGRGIGPEGVRRLLKRLDHERIDGTLELVRTQKAPAET